MRSTRQENKNTLFKEKTWEGMEDTAWKFTLDGENNCFNITISPQGTIST